MRFSIGLAQFKPVRKNVAVNIQRIRQLLKGNQADLIVLPELANSGYLYETPDELLPYADTCKGHGAFISSLIEFAKSSDGIIVSGYAEKCNDNLYNSAVAVSQNGVLANYRKTHLFDREKLLFHPGDSGFFVFDWKRVKIGMMICFDWIFPESTRTLALKGAQIIAHPANLVMPYCQDAMITRSIENRVFTITANRIGTEKLGTTKLKFTGQSQLTNPKGKILFRGPETKTTLHIIDIDPDNAVDKVLNERNDLFKDRRPNFYI
jgi:predicted amidohydrolase